VFIRLQPDGIWNVWSVSRSSGIEKQLTHYTRLNAFVRYPAISPAAICWCTNTRKLKAISGCWSCA